MQKSEKNTIHDIFAGYFEDPEIKKVAYWVSKKLESGNICLDPVNLEKEDNVVIKLENLYSKPYITDSPETNLQPFVIHKNKIYFQRYFEYETKIIEKIKTLISHSRKEEYKKKLITYKDFISNILGDFNERAEIFPWASIAILNSIINNFSIITGGPGTGKTTTITKFLVIVLKLFPEASIALAAPTGKAAARMNQSIYKTIEEFENLDEKLLEKLSKIKTKTIHRLLGYIPDNSNFKHNSENKLKYDIIIIDESSMIDTALLAKLIVSLKNSSKLILLGDKNQLSSVEAGSIFTDLCSFQKNDNFIYRDDAVFYIDYLGNKINPQLDLLPAIISKDKNRISNYIIELKHSYRFDEHQGIGRLSKLVINGILDKKKLLEPFRQCSQQEECAIIKSEYLDNTFIRMLKYYEEYAEEENIEKAFEKLNKVITLCAIREGQYGYKEYNRKIENHLKNKNLIKPDDLYYDKQPVIVTTNNYNLGIFNGDIGIIRIDENGEKRVYFRDEEKSIKDFPVLELIRFETAFAMTIHKSQGSEYENIIIILPDDKHNKILSRQLLYTAITRAKKMALIYGNDDVIQETVKRKIKRISGIKERILE